MNKGVVAVVIPDKEMPRDNTGKIFDIIMNPNGVISRKNSGQLLELYIGKVVMYINDVVQKYISNGKYKQALKAVIDMHQRLLNDTPTKKQMITRLESLLKPTNEKQLEKFCQVISKNKVQLYVEPIDKLNIDRTIKAMNHYGLKQREKIYDPSIGRKTRTEVTFGYMYWEKTEHLSAKKLSARSIGLMSSATGQAVSGKKREGGQRIDELSIHTLASYGVNAYLKEIATLGSDDIKTKYRAMNAIYKNGSVRLADLKDESKSTTAEQLKTVLKAMGVVDPSS